MPEHGPGVRIIGGGLAGAEAALQCAARGVPVELWEMRPGRPTEAHRTEQLAEIVCSNSFGSSDTFSANGLLMAEGLKLGSRLLPIAQAVSVPAGMALAVDREAFAAQVTAAVESEPLIALRREEFAGLDLDRLTLIATGPLTSEALKAELLALLGSEGLFFFDAISPSVALDSLDLTQGLFWGGRGDTGGDGSGGGDYLNVPLEKDEYYLFVDALVHAERSEIKDFEPDKIFQGCQPVELIAASGPNTLRFGPMTPRGLTDPRTGRWPYAVVQLRREERNLETLNLVGFQTRLKWGEQKRVFGMLPGFANAQYSRLGSMHKNFYIDAPRHLALDLSLRQYPNLHLAGQITGSEGYLEAVCTGCVAGINLARKAIGDSPLVLPADTMTGALLAAICDGSIKVFQPFNVHYGMLPEVPKYQEGKKVDKRVRREVAAARALSSLDEMLVARASVPAS